MDETRRRLLKGLAVAPAVAVASAVAPAGRALAGTRAARRGPGSRPCPRLAAGTDTIPQIEPIVVLMMENHSYDNKLGMLVRPGADR